MKLTLLSTTLAVGVAYGQGSNSGWEPAGPDDFRGPCPMMNTLANHGFLPHDGRNITKANAIHALGAGLNFDPALASLMWDQAIIANPEPNATYFTLDNLNRHNVLEHDASLSRVDDFFGNNHAFDQETFDETRVWWTGPVLDANMLANGKLARQLASKSKNPEYTFTANTEQFSLGEVGAPIIVFGDLESATVEKNLIDFFFENERLPVELGWTKKENAVTLEDITRITGIVADATSLLTSPKEAPAARRRDLHSGRGL
ncbi:hypothetical protein V495_00242 [Pseudogymnoascus sp. VKM F-4514 (FW-929)]|nr:hypothetical protein V490_03579 [Pseudogymnoascus sp. VKM F-3557]KFY50442.1 hypothetical protein V495_00242 [Pseudogymnoascus sp. VKM F-4514 (FW-929)]KFY67106.1 hypothetical protein V497_00535 [Pseudogymnoascus sp. VKM F-4516 (FW-969)]